MPAMPGSASARPTASLIPCMSASVSPEESLASNSRGSSLTRIRGRPASRSCPLSAGLAAPSAPFLLAMVPPVASTATRGGLSVSVTISPVRSRRDSRARWTG